MRIQTNLSAPSSLGIDANTSRLVTPLTQLFLVALLLGVFFFPASAGAENEWPPATKPPPPPLTISEKISLSSHIVLGEVERVDYISLSGRPREWKLHDYAPIDFASGEHEILSIKVVEVLKWPYDRVTTSHVKLIHREGSRKDFLARYAPSSRFVFFLTPSESDLKSDPPEFFGNTLVFRVPNYRSGALPEPEVSLPAIRQTLKDSRN